jgi:carbon-monoxide dehydrogenase medium subunit
MKPAAFDYVLVDSVDAAVAQYTWSGDARYLAGGQSLIAALNFRLDTPRLLIDISQIDALRGIRLQGDSVIIGAMTCHAQVASDPLVARHLPLLSEAARHIAHPAIRNRGTIGGSIALADPASEMPACALALSAILHVQGLNGKRTIAADHFFLGMYETALNAGEILTQIEFPCPSVPADYSFAEIARRKGDYAMTGLALVAGPAPRIVWFALSDRPVRARAAEAALAAGAGRDAVVALATEGIDVLGDLNATDDMKQHYARVLLSRLLAERGPT